MQHAWEVFDLSNDELVAEHTRLVLECDQPGTQGDDKRRSIAQELLLVVKQEMHERGAAHAIGRRLSKLPTADAEEEPVQPIQPFDSAHQTTLRAKFLDLVAARPPWLPEESSECAEGLHRAASKQHAPEVLGLWGDERDAGDCIPTGDSGANQDQVEPTEALVAPRQYRKPKLSKSKNSRVGVVNRMGFFVVPSRHRRQSTTLKMKHSDSAPHVGPEGLPQLKKAPPKGSSLKGSSVSRTQGGGVAVSLGGGGGGKRGSIASDISRVRAKLSAAITQRPRESGGHTPPLAPMRSSSAVPPEKALDVCSSQSGRPHSALATTGVARETLPLSATEVPPPEEFLAPIPLVDTFACDAASDQMVEAATATSSDGTAVAAMEALSPHDQTTKSGTAKEEASSTTGSCAPVKSVTEDSTAPAQAAALIAAAPCTVSHTDVIEASVVAQHRAACEPCAASTSVSRPDERDEHERVQPEDTSRRTLDSDTSTAVSTATLRKVAGSRDNGGGLVPLSLPRDEVPPRSPAPAPSASSGIAPRGRRPPFPSLEHMMVDPTHFFTFDTQPTAVQRAASSLLAQLLGVWLCKEAPLPVAVSAAGKQQQARTTQPSLTRPGDVVEDGVDATSAEIRASLREDRSLWYWVQTSHEEVYDLVTGVLDSVEPDDERDEGWRETPPANFFWGTLPTARSGSGGLELNRAVPPACWNLWWTWGKPRVPHASVWLRGVQYVNHIPRSWQLTRKDCLKSNVQRFCKRGGIRSPFFIVPPTYQLPKEYVEFASAFAEDRGIWIMKTIGMSRGRGISLVSEIEHVLYDRPVVVQRYVDRPLTIDGGYKFDLRLYVVVTSFQPQLEAFISRLGFARIAAFRYDVTDLSNKFAHLTNTSISHEAKTKSGDVRIKDGGRRQSAAAQQPTRVDTKWTLEKLEAYFSKRTSHQWSAIWREVKQCVLKALVAVEDRIPAAPCTFELFGFDVLVDESLRPWVLEINASPSLEVDCAEDEAVKPQLIDDVVALLNLPKIDRWALLRALERRAGAAAPGRDSHPRDKCNGFSKAPPLRDEKATEWATEYCSIVGEWEPREVGHVPPQLAERMEVLSPSADAVALQRLKRSCV